MKLCSDLLAEREANYDELVHSNGIIFTWDILFEQYGFEIGDTIQLALYDGNKKIPFTGTLMASTNSSDDTFLIADEVLQQLITETNPTSAIYITVASEGTTDFHKLSQIRGVAL